MVTSLCACAKPSGGLYKWLPNNGGVKVAFAWIPTLRLAFQRQCCDAADEKRLSTSLTRRRNQMSSNTPNYCSRERKSNSYTKVASRRLPALSARILYSPQFQHFLSFLNSLQALLLLSLLFFCKDQYWYLCDGE